MMTTQQQVDRIAELEAVEQRDPIMYAAERRAIAEATEAWQQALESQPKRVEALARCLEALRLLRDEALIGLDAFDRGVTRAHEQYHPSDVDQLELRIESAKNSLYAVLAKAERAGA